MPYLNEKDRKYADVYGPRNSGALNYVITKLCLAYVDLVGGRYDTFNTVIGALESAKLEFYRRAVAPYEDAKAAVNGDIYA